MGDLQPLNNPHERLSCNPPGIFAGVPIRAEKVQARFVPASVTLSQAPGCFAIVVRSGMPSVDLPQLVQRSGNLGQIPASVGAYPGPR